MLSYAASTREPVTMHYSYHDNEIKITHCMITIFIGIHTQANINYKYKILMLIRTLSSVLLTNQLILFLLYDHHACIYIYIKNNNNPTLIIIYFIYICIMGLSTHHHQISYRQHNVIFLNHRTEGPLRSIM